MVSSFPLINDPPIRSRASVAETRPAMESNHPGALVPGTVTCPRQQGVPSEGRMVD